MHCSNHSSRVRTAWGWHSALLAVLLIASAQLVAHPVKLRLAEPVGHVLETRIARPPSPLAEHVDGIVVLGGSTARVAAALALADRHTEAIVVLSGPSPDEVAMVRNKIGVCGRLKVDTRARTTYENALYSKDLVRPRDGQCWVIVTSAVHMPRAVGVFNAVGFPVTPWPVNDTPQARTAMSDLVWHEVLGLVAYRALGRTRVLFPDAGSSNAEQTAPACATMGRLANSEGYTSSEQVLANTQRRF